MMSNKDFIELHEGLKKAAPIPEPMDDMSAEEIKAETFAALDYLAAHTDEWSVRDTLKQFTSWGFWSGSDMANIDPETAQQIVAELKVYLEDPMGSDLDNVYDLVYHYAPMADDTPLSATTSQVAYEKKVEEAGYNKGDTVKVARKAETDEWLVKYYENGKYSEEKTSYHGDKEDAEGTAAFQRKKIAAANETISVDEDFEEAKTIALKAFTDKGWAFTEESKDPDTDAVTLEFSRGDETVEIKVLPVED